VASPNGSVAKAVSVPVADFAVGAAASLAIVNCEDGFQNSEAVAACKKVFLPAN
jgi:hypothetical protein